MKTNNDPKRSTLFQLIWTNLIFRKLDNTPTPKKIRSAYRSQNDQVQQAIALQKAQNELLQKLVESQIEILKEVKDIKATLQQNKS